MHGSLRLCIGIFLVLVAPPTLAEEFRYVLGKKADLLAAPEFGATVIGTAEQGSQLVFLEQHGSWIHVRRGTSRGWVARLLVGLAPPLKKVSALEKLEQTATLNARRRASEVSAAGATRGLTAEARRRANQEDAADFSALSRIEQWSISEQEVATFAETIRGMP